MTFAAAPDRVFAMISDHARYFEMPGVKTSKLLKHGSPAPNGQGAVREIVADGGVRFVEEIFEFDAPRRFAYRITECSLPVEHDFGEVIVHPRPSGCEVEWNTTFTIGIPLIGGGVARLIAPLLRRTFTGMLRSVKERLE